MADAQMIEAGMPGRYATALFELTQETRSTDAVAADLASFERMIADSPDLFRLVRSPVFSAEEQMKAIDALLAKAGIAGLAANFLKLVVQKRRLFAVREIIASFNRLNDWRKGVVHAEVTVAEPLAEKHLDALKAALQQAARGKSVEVAVKVDPSIIGGLIAKLGSRMVDTSLKTKLNLIGTRMKEVG